MKKLSELPMGTTLTVTYRGDIEIIDKEDFLNSSYFQSYPDKEIYLTVAEKTAITLNLYSIISQLGEDEMHDDWIDNVWYDIQTGIDVKGIEKQINDIFEKNPTYWEGELVEIDMMRGITNFEK